MTAREVGGKLEIFPHSVYRVARALELFGCVESSGERPVKFMAKQPKDVVDKLLIIQRRWFLKNFTGENGESDQLGVSFIQKRTESFKMTTEDVRRAKREIFLVVSGDEIPAELVLENKLAIERGVKIKILVQRVDKDNQDMLKNWQKMGIQVRQSPLIEARIIIFDSQIVYLMSYRKEKVEESLGVRLNYPPIARVMREMLMQRWKETKRI